MSDRSSELRQRRTALQLRCAVQRRELGAELAALEARVRFVDRAAVMSRSVVRHPAVIAGGAALLMVLGRKRLSLVGRVLLLGATIRRLWRTL